MDRRYVDAQLLRGQRQVAAAEPDGALHRFAFDLGKRQDRFAGNAAVVATEVKNLATQAAKATDQISREIDGIQSISGEVVGALDGIRSSIESVRDYVLTTASAVEEQTAVTGEMSRSMQGASTAVSAITRNIGDIGVSIRQVAAAVGKTKEAAHVLAR